MSRSTRHRPTHYRVHMSGAILWLQMRISMQLPLIRNDERSVKNPRVWTQIIFEIQTIASCPEAYPMQNFTKFIHWQMNQPVNKLKNSLISFSGKRNQTDEHFSELSWVEQGLMSHQTHYRSYRGRVFTGQMTQPTVSKHWRKTQD